MIKIPGRPTSWKRVDGGRRRHTSKRHAIAAQRIRIVARDLVPEGWSLDGRFAMLVVSDYRGGVEELPDALSAHAGPRAEADWDNLGKLVSDALQGLLWRDDRQVVDGRSVKRYGQPAEQTHVLVWRVR